MLRTLHRPGRLVPPRALLTGAVLALMSAASLAQTPDLELPRPVSEHYKAFHALPGASLATTYLRTFVTSAAQMPLVFRRCLISEEEGSHYFAITGTLELTAQSSGEAAPDEITDWIAAGHAKLEGHLADISEASCLNLSGALKAHAAQIESLMQSSISRYRALRELSEPLRARQVVLHDASALRAIAAQCELKPDTLSRLDAQLLTQAAEIGNVAPLTLELAHSWQREGADEGSAFFGAMGPSACEVLTTLLEPAALPASPPPATSITP